MGFAVANSQRKRARILERIYAQTCSSLNNIIDPLKRGRHESVLGLEASGLNLDGKKKKADHSGTTAAAGEARGAA